MTKHGQMGLEGGIGNVAGCRQVVFQIHRGHLEGSSGMCSNPHPHPCVLHSEGVLEQDMPIVRCPLSEDCEAMIMKPNGNMDDIHVAGVKGESLAMTIPHRELGGIDDLLIQPRDRE